MNTICGPASTTLNLILFTAGDRQGAAEIVLRDHRLKHLRHVHRANVGDTLRVGEVGGLMGKGEVLQIDEDRATLAISLDQLPPEKLPLCLVLALPRPKMLRRILRTVAEFGVSELHLINSYRVEKSYWQSPVLQEDVLREYLIQGLEQSRDTQLPSVHCYKSFKPFVEDILPAMIADKYALLAHPGENAPCPRNLSEQTLLVIGPEGGFIPYEVEKLKAAGCDVVSLGPRILRVENAVTALLSRLF
jgi:RsmE family RNA methyltransferase